MGPISLAIFFLAQAPGLQSPLQLRDGDRVIFLGDAVAESSQVRGDLETRLTSAFPEADVTFRNLAYAGDTLDGHALAAFDTPAQGYQRRLDLVREARPTVALLGFGANESWAGPDGLPAFTRSFERLLDDLQPLQLRETILVSPPRQENLGPPYPDPTSHNADLALYRDAIRDLASKRGLRFLDLGSSTGTDDRSIPPYPLTDDGLHPTDYGHWKLAQAVESSLSPPADDPPLVLTPTDGRLTATHTAARLPAPVPPQGSPPGSAWPSGLRVVRAPGLAPGRYTLLVDGHPTATADAPDWARGVSIDGPERDQVEQLRLAIASKNRLFFDRTRPQNDVYLFGFRKHEQGNNAVEIPQFDPLISDREALISSLRAPRPHTYELVRADEVKK